jgi:uncharacterized protein DUF6084
MTAISPRASPAAGSIPELRFAVLAAERVEHAAVPTLRFRLRIESVRGEPIKSVLLDTQLQIAARRRAYDTAAQDRLFELFGPPSAWGTTLRTLLWTRTTLVVPPFAGSTLVDLPVTCTYDLEVAASRYFDALQDGDVPLEFLFSGSVFYGGEDGRLQTARLSWESEAGFRMPVRVWKETMEHHFRGQAWLRLDKPSFDRLCAYKSREGLATWEDVLARLLPEERDR